MMLSEIKFKLNNVDKKTLDKLSNFIESVESVTMDKFPISINSESNNLDYTLSFDDASGVLNVKSRIDGDKTTTKEDDFLTFSIETKNKDVQTLNHKLSIAEFPLVLILCFLKIEMKDDIDVFFNDTKIVNDIFLFLSLNQDYLDIKINDIFIENQNSSLIIN